MIRIYERALCCNTGVCGTDIPDELVSFTADVSALSKRGVDIARANLASDPGAFAENEAVTNFLKIAGSAGLPLTIVDGVTVLTGRYPTRKELMGYAGLTMTVTDTSCSQGEAAAGDESACCSASPTDSATCCSSNGSDA